MKMSNFNLEVQTFFSAKIKIDLQQEVNVPAMKEKKFDLEKKFVLLLNIKNQRKTQNTDHVTEDNSWT